MGIISRWWFRRKGKKALNKAIDDYFNHLEKEIRGEETKKSLPDYSTRLRKEKVKESNKK